MQEQERQQLINKAIAAREFAYTPYSDFKVGAAVLTENNQVFVGCNVENAAYGDTICAERAAVFSAVAAGERKFKAVAIVTDTKKPASPCGSCRQVLAEFGIDLEIVCANLKGDFWETDLKQLLPKPFAEDSL